MKYILVILFIFSHQANSASCKQLRQDLIAVDYKLNFEKCDKAKEQTCSHKGSYNKMLLEYNADMARLIIEEGIIAIGESIENSNNSLAFLKDVNLDKAENYFNKFDDSLSKAALLENAMSIEDQLTETKPDGTKIKISMWSPNNIPEEKISSLRKFERLLSTEICNSIDNKKFCENIFAKNLSEEKKQELTKTLYGFVKADREIMRSESAAASTITVHDKDPTKRYESYIKKWEIRGLDNKKVTVNTVREKLKNQDTLKQFIDAYKEEKNEENAKNLISAANKLEPLSVSYTKNDSDGVHKFLDQNIRKALMGTKNAIGSISDSILTDHLKENLNNQKKVVSQTYDFLKKEIAEEEKRNPANKIETSFNKLELKAHKELENKLSMINACYDSSKSASEKKECLIRERKSLYSSATPSAKETDLVALRAKLQKTKDKLSYHNNLPPFKDFLIQKALITNELNKPKCSDSITNENIEITSQSFCNADYKDKILDTKTLSFLDSDAKEITLHMQNEYVGDALNAGLSQEKIDSFKAQLKTKCSPRRKEDAAHIRNLCSHFNTGTIKREVPQVQTPSERRRRKVINLSSRSEEKASSSSIFWNSFLQGTVTQLPGLVSTWASYDSTKHWRDTQLDGIAAQESYYQSTKAYRDAYFEDLNAQRMAVPEYYSYENYGMAYTQTGYNVASNFQADNTGQIYNSATDPLQNMFNVPSNLTLPPASVETPYQTNFSFDVNV